MKVVYIAGPFTAPTPWHVAENVRNAERWALRVAQSGAMPLCPHANTSLFYGQMTPEFWYSGTIELLRRCDAALFITDWHSSKGSRAEREWCAEHELPAFHVHHMGNGEFARWVRDGLFSP